MSKKIKKLLNNKYFIVALVALLIVLVIGTGTYAWLTWSSPNTTKLTVKIGNIADVIFDNGKEINTTSLAPVFTYDQGEKTSFSIVKRSTAASTNIDYTITLNITSIAAELKVASFKYVLLNGNQVVRQGDFSSASSGDAISLSSSTLTDTRADFTFYIYIDGNTENNANMMNKEFKATINVSASESSSSGPTMAQYILDLYNNNKNSTMANSNSNTEYSIASSESLMNDRLGGTTEDLDGGNVRYYGYDPNNYIYFNQELWRIIGVFDGKVKIIRNEPLSQNAAPMNYTLGSTDADNIYWKNSVIAQFLNPWYADCQSYWNIDGGTSNSCELNNYTETVSSYNTFVQHMLDVALKEESRNKTTVFPKYLYSISDIINGSDKSLETFYQYNVSNIDTTSNDIYVGILDVVDYGYAADFDSCGGEALDNYAQCGSGSWLFLNSSYNEFLINAESSQALLVDTEGNIIVDSVTSEGYFRPVVYLNTDVKYDSGVGAADDPYVLYEE